MTRLPAPHHGISIDGPSTDWADGIPLGNGLLGAMIWGTGAPLAVSLDRTDLWDLREVPEFSAGGSSEYSYALMRAWHEQGRTEDLLRVYDDAYRGAAPTRIPTGRLEIAIGAVARTELDLAAAIATAHASDGGVVRSFVSALEPVGWLQIRGRAAREPAIRLVAPSFAAPPDGPASLGRLGYPPVQARSGRDFVAFEQAGAEGLSFAVHAAWRRSGDELVLAWSVASNRDGVDPARAAAQAVERALERGFARFLEEHTEYWRHYWEKSSVRMADATLERLWHLELYKFGSAARRDAPPIALQGPWTLDNGELPPWKGDYHHDLNTELCYWPAYAGNHLEEQRGFLDWLWDTRAACFDWTARFFGLPGLNVPMTADLLNRQMGGWRQYTHSSTCSAWLAHHFYLHFRYSQDREFLRDRAYPYLRDVATFLEAVTRERDAAGRRTLPLSASPEVHDNRPEAWFPSITNFDNALIRWLFGAASELALELGLRAEAARFGALRAELPELALGSDQRLLIARDHPLPYSHRHHSHLLAIHPLGLIDPLLPGAEASAARAIAGASLGELERAGTRLWNGYSFSWAACLWARAGDGARAARALHIFDEAFVSKSSLHVNGDQTARGYADTRGRPMTLEGNFAAAEGVQQMLLQSQNGLIRLFPAVPEELADASFTLRAEGAFLVSAEMSGGRVKRVAIESEAGGPCRLLSPWSGRLLELSLRAGETRELRASDGAREPS